MKYIKFWLLGSVALAGLSFLIWMMTGSEGGAEAADGCSSIQTEVAAVLESATNATGPGYATGDRIADIRKGQQISGYKHEHGLRMIVNNPQCFSASNVAQAQTDLSRLTR